VTRCASDKTIHAFILKVHREPWLLLIKEISDNGNEPF